MILLNFAKIFRKVIMLCMLANHINYSSDNVLIVFSICLLLIIRRFCRFASYQLPNGDS